MVADLVQTGLTSWWAPALAFLAGIVSFASPCVFPLVPGYVAFVTGSQTEEEPRPLVPVLLFIGGFSAVFTVIGAASRVFVPIFRSEWGLRLAGLVILGFGVVMILYALRLGNPGLYAERRPFLAKVKPGRAGAFPLGMAFAAGWTPCIGPVLAGVIAIAGAQGGSVRGGWLLFVYSVGLGLPFLLVGLGLGKMVRGLSWIKRNYRWIAGVSGGLMVFIGVLMVAGLWLELLNPVLQWVRGFTPAL